MTPAEWNVLPTAFGSPWSHSIRYGLGDQSACLDRSATHGHTTSGFASIVTVNEPDVTTHLPIRWTDPSPALLGRSTSARSGLRRADETLTHRGPASGEAGPRSDPRS